MFYIKKDDHINDNRNSQFSKILCIPNSLNPSQLNNFFKHYNIRIISSQSQILQNIIKRGKDVSEPLDRTNLV